MSAEKGQSFNENPQFEIHGKTLDCCAWSDDQELAAKVRFALAFEKRYHSLRRNVQKFLSNFSGKDQQDTFKLHEDHRFDLNIYPPGSVFRFTTSFPGADPEKNLAMLEEIKLNGGEPTSVLLYGSEFPQLGTVGGIRASWRDQFIVGKIYHDRILAKDKRFEFLYRIDSVEVLAKGARSRATQKEGETIGLSKLVPIPTRN